MLFIVGLIIVLGAVFGGFIMHGGRVPVLWQPSEFIIILGSAIGAYIISNPPSLLSKVPAGFKALLSGPKYKEAHFLELLTLLYATFKLIKTKGALAIEAHLENPSESELFKKFPSFLADHHAVVFLCDYLRLMTMNTDDPHQVDALMELELETHHHEALQVAESFQAMSDALPALGIVAAVLGVINTMGSITEPPEILGRLIGGALVGTFFGVLVSYGIVGPMATSLKAIVNAEGQYMACIRSGFVAHLKGCAPAVSIEFARKTLFDHYRPSFEELEKACEAV